MKFSIDSRIIQMFPNVKIGVLLAKNVNQVFVRRKNS